MDIDAQDSMHLGIRINSVSAFFIDKKKLNKTKFLSFRSIKMYKNNSGKRPILGNGFLGFDFLENVLQSARERFVFIMFDVVMCFQ